MADIRSIEKELFNIYDTSGIGEAPSLFYCVIGFFNAILKMNYDDLEITRESLLESDIYLGDLRWQLICLIDEVALLKEFGRCNLQSIGVSIPDYRKTWQYAIEICREKIEFMK